MHTSRYLWMALAVALAVSGCSGPRQTTTAGPVDQSAAFGSYKVGTPYQINGIWYTPAEDFFYDEIGEASWYGPGFHGRTTANGETFDRRALTAAHPTLQMPTLVRVTNLENGRSLVLRINDRGPFAHSRLIDVSERAAELLGFREAGVATVRVQVLTEESQELASLAGRRERDAIASAPPANPPAAAPPAAPVAREPAVVVAAPPPTAVPAPTVEPAATPARPAPDPAPQLAGTGRFYVLAGAFTVEQNARRVESALSRYGPVSIDQATVDGTLFHRVRVGPFANMREANAALGRVLATGIEDARVVDRLAG